MNKRQHQQGMTLIEIMISMLIGLFLIGGVMQIFISTKETYRVQENLSRMQESGRFAMSFLARDLRMAGFQECAKEVLFSGNYIAGTNNTGLNGSDTVSVVWRSNVCGAAVTAVSRAYTVANSAGSPSLFREDDGGGANALVEGIENMQILYGEDTTNNGSANYYVDADNVVTMSNVVSVRVSLLVRSIDDNLTSAPRDYLYNGVTTTPTDRRLRRVFTSTIKLRNR